MYSLIDSLDDVDHRLVCSPTTGEQVDETKSIVLRGFIEVQRNLSEDYSAILEANDVPEFLAETMVGPDELITSNDLRQLHITRCQMTNFR